VANPNDPALKSFVETDPASHFPIQNLPFGIFSTDHNPLPRAGVAIGDMVLDLSVLESQGYLTLDRPDVFSEPTLNTFLACGRDEWRRIRQDISRLLRHDNPTLRDNDALRAEALVPTAQMRMHLPVVVGGFSDYLCSLAHTRNCARILGGGDEIHPNWHHMPLAYNGRASSVTVGGTPVKRPWGQTRHEDGTTEFSPTKCLDFELEFAIVIGSPNGLGRPLTVADAPSHIFGVVLLNDWSARDVQYWEMKPQGVFDSKNFMTSISPWIVAWDALEPFRTEGPKQDPAPLPYLSETGKSHIDATVQALIRPQSADLPLLVCQSYTRELYWSFAQQLVHQTSAGCNVMPGDLIASGTVSTGSAPGEMGCLLEASYDGSKPVILGQGTERLYLEDGDEVILTGWCEASGYRVGFGQCSGVVLPADTAWAG